jgi:NADH-quinone oxidoreductase subunit G
MAAVADVQTVNITVNEMELAVPKGELIVESVKRLGLEIPIFCYHPRMKPVGMCRMCLVEVGFKQQDGTVRKMPKPQAACTLPASDGMVIYTDTELVHTDRKGVLEFLLINHPLDCPICDRGGECPLQNNTLFYGPSTSRYVEIKRHLPKAFPLSQYVTLDLERCIQCGRCVRFTEEISGDSQLAFRFRGAQMQPSTFELRDFTSKFSGNVIEICPVGALTNSKYRFRARPWDLETKPGICTLCSNGCNVWMDHRVGKLVRINGRTNEAVNEEWTCDRGKFGHDFLNSEKRLGSPLARKGSVLAPVDWSAAYSEVLRAFTSGKGDSCAALVGPALSNEDLFLLKRLFNEEFGSRNLDYRFTTHLPAAVPSTVQGTIAELENRASILILGTNLADDAPIVHLRVRKAWFKNAAKVVVAHHGPTDADSFAHTVLRYRPGTGAILAKGLSSELSAEQVEAQTGVPAGRLSEALEVLSEGTAVLTSTAIHDAADSVETIAALETVANRKSGSLSVLATGANERGAELLGIAGGGLNSQQILEGCANGTIKSLWLAGVNPFEACADRDLVERALENVEFLVVQDVIETEAMSYASVVLPALAPAETDGTFTNCDGRVQRLKPALRGVGDAKPAWKIYNEVSLRIRPATPFFNAMEVLGAIAQSNPAFRTVTPSELDSEGILISA